MKRFGQLICIAFAFGSLVFAGTVSVQPSAPLITLGTSLMLDVTVSGIADLFAWQFDIGFDPAVLSAVSVTEGALFGSVGVLFSPGFIDNTAGTVTFIGDSLSGPGPGISTNGTLATIMFNSIGAGTSSLSPSNIVLLDSNLGDITATASGNSVTVTGGISTVPEPATFLLMLPVLAAIGWRIRSRPAR